jgi:hypothetical protein
MPSHLTTYSYSDSLSSCQDFSELFDNTCTTSPPTAASSVSALSGVDVECSTDYLPEASCPGTVDGDVCTFTYKLCVSCSNVGGNVKIRVQSNGLPSHCVYVDTGDTISSAIVIDYSVMFLWNQGTSTLTSVADN